MEFDAGKYYATTGGTMQQLERIKSRLYTGPLSNDERRDMANAIDAIIHTRFEEVD